MEKDELQQKIEFHRFRMDYRKCISLIEQSSSEWQKDHALLYQYIHCLLDLGELEAAEVKYNRYLSIIDQNEVSAQILASKIAIKNGKTEQFLKVLEGGNFIAQSSIDAHSMLSLYYRLQGDFKQSINYSEKILSSVPGHLPALLNRGLAYFSDASYDSAEKDLCSFFESKPEFTDAHNILIETLLKTNKQAKLLSVLEQIQRSSKLSCKLQHLYFEVAFKVGEFPKAIIIGERLLEESTEDANLWLGMVHAYLEVENYQTALKTSLVAADKFADSCKIQIVNARTLRLTGNLEKGVERLEALSKVFPKDNAVKQELALAYFGVMNLPKAIEIYRQLMEVGGYQAFALYGLAVAATKNDDFEQAKKYLMDAWKQQPLTAELIGRLLELPNGYLSQKELDEIESVFRKSKFEPTTSYLFEAFLARHKGDLRRAYKNKRKWNTASAPPISLSDGMIKRLEKLRKDLKNIENFEVDDNNCPDYGTHVLILGPSASGKSTLEEAISIHSDRVIKCGEVFDETNFEKIENIEKSFKKLGSGTNICSKNIYLHTRPGILFSLPLINSLNVKFCLIGLKRNITDLASDIVMKRYSQGNFYAYRFKTAMDYVISFHRTLDQIGDTFQSCYTSITVEKDELEREKLGTFLNRHLNTTDFEGFEYQLKNHSEYSGFFREDSS